MKDIVYDGSKQKFSDSELQQVDELLSMSVRLIDDGRFTCPLYKWHYRYHTVLNLFIPDLEEWLAMGYVIHHIDGNPSNDHPSNLILMSRSAHSKYHESQYDLGGWYGRQSQDIQQQRDLAISKTLKETNANMPEERQREIGQIKSIGQQARWDNISFKNRDEMSKIQEEAQGRRWKNKSNSRRNEIGINISTARGGMMLKGQEFLEQHDREFIASKFGDATGYADPRNALYGFIEDIKVEIVRREKNMNIYKSLIFRRDYYFCST